MGDTLDELLPEEITNIVLQYTEGDSVHSKLISRLSQKSFEGKLSRLDSYLKMIKTIDPFNYQNILYRDILSSAREGDLEGFSTLYRFVPDAVVEGFIEAVYNYQSEIVDFIYSNKIPLTYEIKELPEALYIRAAALGDLSYLRQFGDPFRYEKYFRNPYYTIFYFAVYEAARKQQMKVLEYILPFYREEVMPEWINLEKQLQITTFSSGNFPL